MKKFESERNALFSVILGLIPRIHIKHLANVILGFIPRIHSEHSSLDTRDTPEYDRDLMVDSRVKPENDYKQNLIKGLDVVRQCATLLERRVQSGTRVRKAQAVTRQTNECIETAESGVDKVVSSCEKNPNVHKTYMNFLRQRKTALDAPLHAVSSGRLLPHCALDATGFLSDAYKRSTRAQKFLVDGVQCGRSMIEMLGVLAIIGVLSVGGIAGYSKAMETYKINQTKRQLTEIITNIQTLYMQQKDFNSLGNYTAVQTGIVPDDLKTSVDRYGITNITNAFGSPVIIAGYSDYYIIRFLNVTKEGCTALATTDWGNSASSGLVAIGIGFITGESDTLFEENQVGKNCTSQGVDEARYSAYYACANHLPLSPALAAQHCIDTGEDWGYDNSFTIMISK